MAADDNLSMQFHAQASGQGHFPGIMPAPEAVPVHFDMEKSQLNARISRRDQNRKWPVRQGVERNELTEDTPASHYGIKYHPAYETPSGLTAEDHVAFRRLGKEEMVPRNEIHSMQPHVTPERVESLRKNPRLGQGVRFRGAPEMPEAERLEDNKVTVHNGNHRTAADLANGRLFVPMRVVDSRDPGTRKGLVNYRNQKSERRDAELMRLYGSRP